MSVAVALANPVVMFLFWIALPATFVGLAWRLISRGRDSALLLLWMAATILLAAAMTWLVPPQVLGNVALSWGARAQAFLQMAVILGASLAAIALLSRRQRARGVHVLSVGLVVRAIVAYVGVGLLLSLAIVAVSIARDVAVIPVSRVLSNREHR